MPDKEIKDVERSGINLVCLVSSVFITLILYLAQRGQISFVKTEDYFTALSMAALLISLPDLLANSFFKSKAWFTNSAAITILLVVVLAFCGILKTFDIDPFYYFRYAIWGGGIFLFLFEIFRLKHVEGKYFVFVGVVVITGIVIREYSQSYHSLNFEKKILEGIAHVDILFHMAISNMFSSGEWSTTGLHGTAYMNYHWFSHTIFAGIKNLTGSNVHVVYNLVYPTVFIPLFFKVQYRAAVDFCRWKGLGQIRPLAYYTFSALLYWLVNLNFLKHLQPLSSESFCVSLILGYSFFSCLMKYGAASSKKRNWFYIFSAVLILIILFTKISTGFILLSGLILVGALRDFNLSNVLLIFVLLVLILIPSYFFLFPLDRTTVSVSLVERVYGFMLGTHGGLVFLPGAVLFFQFLSYKPKKESWMNFLWGSLKSDMGFLGILMIASLICGIYVSNNSSDVFYFVAVQFFFTILYIFGYLNQAVKKWYFKKGKRAVLLAVLAVMSTFAHPEVWLQIVKEIKVEGKDMDMTENERFLFSSLTILRELEQRPDKSSIAVYIPSSEKWFHHSQSYRPLASLFVVPAYSGIASVGGIPDSLLRTNYNYYSIYYYRDQEPLLSVTGIESAKKAAAELGYKLLVVLRTVEGRLIVEYNDLNELHN